VTTCSAAAPTLTNVAASEWRAHSISNGATRPSRPSHRVVFFLSDCMEHAPQSSANRVSLAAPKTLKALVRFIFVCPLLFKYPIMGLSHILGTNWAGEWQAKRKPHIPIRRVAALFVVRHTYYTVYKKLTKKVWRVQYWLRSNEACR
jgi:hypothetical protein